MRFHFGNNITALTETYDDIPAPEMVDNSDEKWSLIEQMAKEEKEREEADAFSERRFEDIVKMRLIAEG